MKYVIGICCLLFPALVHAQGDERKADQVLTQLLLRLKAMDRVSYHYHRETRYFADNYQNLSDADMYIDFRQANAIGLRFRSSNEARRSVFNGATVLQINEKDRTIDTMAARTAKSLSNNSDLYHSFAMLKNILPLVIGSDSIRRSVSDTVLMGKTYTCVTMEGDHMYFGLFDGINRFTAQGLRRPYYLLIDPLTGLPYQFATRYIRNDDDRDFINVTYTSIDTHPAQPLEESWLYTYYTNAYKHLPPVRRTPMVKAGAIVENFSLPVYTPIRIDSAQLSRYSGKVVLLDFWFKSCGPCMEAMPKYNKLQSMYASRGFQLLTVNIEDPVEDIRFFHNKHHPNYPMLFKGAKVFERLGLRGCPSSVLIDRSGKVVRVFEGFDEARIGEEIDKLL